MLETSYLVMETHANSTLSKCMLLACAYQSAKENGHCQIKILPRLWTTIWQRKAVWKTLFQNKSGGTINPVYLPQTTPEQNKEGVNKNTLSISNLAQYFILQLGRNIPLTTMTSIELRLLLLYHSKGEMLRREQAKGHRKGTRAWQNDIQSL